MNKFKLCKNITFVIMDNCVVLLDFNTGDFFVLSDEFIPIFNQINSNNIFDGTNENQEMIKNLLKNHFITKI